MVTAENVNQLLDESGAPPAPEVLVVDIDGNDFWVLAALLSARTPRVIVAESNGSLGRPSWWVQPYQADRSWDRTAWHGAGLAALQWLMASHSYTLVGCDSNGVNAFFTRCQESERFRPGHASDRFVHPDSACRSVTHGGRCPS